MNMESMTSPFSRDTVLSTCVSPSGVCTSMRASQAWSDDGLLAGIEIALDHVRDVALRRHRPLAHRVRIGPRVLLDRLRRATVRVALTQDRVDRTAEARPVALGDLELLGGLGILRVV